MAWRLVPVVLFHLLPLVPLGLGYFYGALAAALFVTLPYIKTQKLSAHIRELEAVPPTNRTELLARELASLRRARNLWRSLTFRNVAEDS